MVRGVNRSIIEVNDTGNKYFERVLFFINPDYSSADDKKLQKAAVDYIKNAEGQHRIKRKKPRKRNLAFALAAAAVAATAVCVILLLI